MAIRMLKVVAFAGALAVAAPALATKMSPPKAGAKKGAVKKAPASPRPAGWKEALPIETDCFAMHLPGNMVPYQRIKSANKGYIGTWGFVSAPKANLKIWVRCNPSKKKVAFKDAFGRSLQKMRGWIHKYSVQSTYFTKTDEGHDIANAVGVGYLKSIDKKSHKTRARRHMISRTYVNLPNRNLRVSVTIAVAGKWMERIAQITQMVLKNFRVIEPVHKAKIKAKVKAKHAAVKAKATKVR